MQTLNWIKKEFADEMFSWTCEQDYEDPKEYHDMINNYINDLEIANPEWERENLIWESWYLRWYEVALNELKTKYEKTIEYDASYRAKQIVENLNYLLTN